MEKRNQDRAYQSSQLGPVPSETHFEGRIHRLANIGDRQFILRIQAPNVATQMSFANTVPVVNVVKPTLKLWHQRMGHLGYRNILRLSAIADGIDVKGSISDTHL